MNLSPQKFLLFLFIAMIAISLAIVTLYECDVLTAANYNGHGVSEYHTVMIMELLTICLIPFSLRLFKFKHVRRQLTSNAASALRKWGAIRLFMIALPMIINTILYYQFMNVAFGYLAIICLLSLAFIYPSKAKCDQETNKNT